MFSEAQFCQNGDHAGFVRKYEIYHNRNAQMDDFHCDGISLLANKIPNLINNALVFEVIRNGDSDGLSGQY